MYTPRGLASQPTLAPLHRGAAAALRDSGTLFLTLVLLATAWSTSVPAAALRLSQLPSAWVDDRGQSFDLRSLQGHAVVLTMAYATCHRVCPTTMSRLQRMQQDFDRRGSSVEILVIGYDPDSDDAAAWHQYRRSRHLTRDNWHFLVGTRTAVQQIARQLGFDFWKYDQHVMHGSRIVAFDEHGSLLNADGQAGTAEHTEVGQ